VTVYDVFPRHLPDLFMGSQLIVTGRYKNETSAKVVLTGMSGKKRRRYSYETNFSRSRENDFIPRLWASRKVAYLLDEIRINGGEDELRDEVEELCLEHGLMSPYTSFLVQEDEPVVARRSGRHRDVGILPAPAGAALSGAGHGGHAAVGKQAVEASKMVRQMRESDRVEIPQDKRSAMRFIDGCIFHLREGEWVDSRFREQDVFAVKYNSQAYVNLLLAYPEFGKYMKLGDRIAMKFRDRFIRIGDSGKKSCSQKEWRGILN
jgi:Ca-activated chloride channel family protein